MVDFPDTRESLLARIRDHDHESWYEFIKIYEPAIYWLARKKGLQDADALDVTQEVLAKVSKSLQRWDPDKSKGTFGGWVYRLVANATMDVFRKRVRQTQGSGDTQTMKLLEQSVLTETDETQLRNEYRRELFEQAANAVRSEFSNATWNAFWLTSVDGMSVENAAKKLSLSKGSIYVARSRVLSRIRERVQRIEDL